jgi:3-oxoadipate enol-lactonase
LSYLRANGVVLNVEVRGRGEPTVLISDIGEDLTSWCYQARTFGSLHFLLQLDNRGSGRSDCPPEGCSIKDMAKDVLSAMDLIGVDKAHLVGLGLGGMIAQMIALLRPGRVGGLVLVSTSSRATEEQREVYEKWVRSANDGHDRREISRNIVPWLYSSWFLENERWREFVIKARGSRYGQTCWEGAAAQLKAMLDFDSSERLGDIASPTLVVSGSEDRITPPECSKSIHAGIKGSRHLQLRAGHLLHVELPRSFNQAVLGFLAEVEGCPAPDLGPGPPLPCGGCLGL